MMNPFTQNHAISGMAAVFADAPDLACFWRNCVNPGVEFHRFPGQMPENDASVVLKRVIEQACRDAGILMDEGLPPGVRILVCSPDGCGERERDALAVAVGFDETPVDLLHARDFPGLAVFGQAMAAFDQNTIDFVVTAAFHRVPAVECAAVVLCRKPFLIPETKVYGFIRSFQCLEKARFKAELKTLPAKGIGHLVLVSGDAPAWTASETGPGNALPQMGKDPSAFYPGCMISSSGDEEGPVSGMRALIRAAMSVNAGIISPCPDPAKVFFTADDIGFTPSAETRPWIHDREKGSRRAAVGVPAYKDEMVLMVLEEVVPGHSPEGFVPRPVMTGLTPESELVVLAADSATDLGRQVERLLEWTRGEGCEPDRVASYLSRQFDSRKPYRLALVCRTDQELVQLLEICDIRLRTSSPDFESDESIYYTAEASVRPGRVACLFPGLGFPGLLGPYADHLMSLALHFPQFREVFDRVESRDSHPDDPVSTSLIFFPPAAWPDPVRSGLRNRLASPRIEEVLENNHPAHRNLSSFGVSVANWACWQLLRELHIEPDFLFGQSLGELSALCASGAIDFNEFIRISWQVTLKSNELLKNGRLALVSAGAQTLAPYLEDFENIHIAIHVGPQFQILGGDFQQLRELVPRLRGAGIWTHFLPFPAIHTPRLTALRPLMAPHLSTLAIKPPLIPVYSGMTAGLYPQDVESIRQIMIANIDHPVLLWQTTQKLYEDGVRLLIQAGGGATMSSQARTNIGDNALTAVSLDVDYRPALTQLHHLCAALLVKGIDVRVRYLYEHRGIDDSCLEGIFHNRDTREQRTDGQPEVRMPFIGTVRKYVENTEIVLERVIDLNRDAFLRDHLFVNARGVKPDCACLPVVPMTISLEMMAEAAACLAPGCGLTGFEDVRASRWMALLDCDALPVRVVAQYDRLDPITGIHRITATIFTADDPKPAILGKVLFGRHYAEELVPNFTPIDAPYRYPFEKDAVYRDRHLFHGPVFQCVTGQPVLTGKKVIGTLRVLSKHKMFTHIGNPEFLCDPVLLDGVGQLAGLWAIDQGKYVFPIGIKKLEIYCPTPDVGSDLPVLLEVTEFSHKILSADIEIQDGKGSVWMRIHHWQDWVFHWSASIYDFRRNPEHCLPSHSVSGNGMPGDTVIRYVSKNDLKDIWLDVAARFFLHPDEMKAMMHINPPETRWPWLMGRIVAKDALRQWLAKPSSRMLHPAGILMEDREDGNPVLKNPGHPDHLGLNPVIRVLCSGTGAVASVSAVEANVDLNRIMMEIEKPRGETEKEPVSWQLSS